MNTVKKDTFTTMQKNTVDLPDDYDALYGHFHKVKMGVERESSDYVEYRKLWKKAAVEHIVTKFPLHLDIEITSHCNLLCTMCPRTHRVERGDWVSEHMSFERFCSIIDEGVDNGLCAINLNNFGESFMNKDIYRMIGYAKNRGVLEVMLHTNGTIMSEKIASRTIESGLDKIIFSVDSVEKETYESIRVGARFEKVINNVRTFSRVRRKFGSVTPEIRISMVLMNENAHQLEDFKRYWGDDVDTITYVDYRNQDGLDNEDRYLKKRKENRAYACPSLWQRMTINSSGQVTACCRDAGKRLEIGNLDTSESLLSIWKGTTLSKARKLHQKGEGWKLDACNGCDHIRGWQPSDD